MIVVVPRAERLTLSIITSAGGPRKKLDGMEYRLIRSTKPFLRIIWCHGWPLVWSDKSNHLCCVVKHCGFYVMRPDERVFPFEMKKCTPGD